jgi:hypothetical protein
LPILPILFEVTNLVSDSVLGTPAYLEVQDLIEESVGYPLKV